MTSCLISFSTLHSTPPMVCCGYTTESLISKWKKNNNNFMIAVVEFVPLTSSYGGCCRSVLFFSSCMYHWIWMKQEINRRRSAFDCTDTPIEYSISTIECKSTESISTTAYVASPLMPILWWSTATATLSQFAARSRTFSWTYSPESCKYTHTHQTTNQCVQTFERP